MSSHGAGDGNCSIGVFLLSKPISAYEMGEAYAANMGAECEEFQSPSCIAVQCAGCLRNGICGSCILCGDSSAASGEVAAGHARPILLIPACFWRFRVLPVLRSAGKNHVFSDRVVHQHSDSRVWCARCHLYYDTQKKRKGGIG